MQNITQDNTFYLFRQKIYFKNNNRFNAENYFRKKQ